MRQSLPFVLMSALPLLAQAPEAPKQAWSDKGSLSYVSVGGNAASQSLGFANEYKYTWSDAAFAFNLGGVRVSTTTFARSASGASLADATVVQTSDTRTSSESYYANLRYDRSLSDRLQWFASGGWERNLPAGLEARTSALAGIGHWWIKEDRTKCFTDAGLGYTKETQVFRPAGADTGFATFRLGAKIEQKVFATSLLASELTLSDSLKNSQNYLAVWRTAFTTNLSSRLALKVAYDVTYKNQPASVAVDVIQTPVATPPVVIGQVPYQLKKTDTVFTTSLVVTF